MRIIRAAVAQSEHRETGVRSPAEAKDFFSSLCDQTSCDTQPASYPIGTGDPSGRGKARPGTNAGHLSPSNT
jgi:hypothetical protein